MKKWFITWAIGQLIARITLDEQAIVKYVNSKIDIPRMDEKDEAKLYISILRALKAFIRGF